MAPLGVLGMVVLGLVWLGAIGALLGMGFLAIKAGKHFLARGLNLYEQGMFTDRSSDIGGGLLLILLGTLACLGALALATAPFMDGHPGHGRHAPGPPPPGHRRPGRAQGLVWQLRCSPWLAAC